VHVDAVAAAVHLRRPELHQVPQPGLQLDRPLELGHRPELARRQLGERDAIGQASVLRHVVLLVDVSSMKTIEGPAV
jgi:hypothetical protein